MHASRAFAVILWIDVALVAAIAAANGTSWKPVALSAVVAALIGTFAALRAPSALWTRLVVAAALTAGPALMVYAGRGPWQADWHLYFFVIFGALVAYVDWRPIALSAALTAFHHLLLDALDPAAVFPEPGVEHALLHVAAVLATLAVLCLIVQQMRRILNRLTESMATARLALDQARLYRLALDRAGDAVIVSDFKDGASIRETMRSQRTVYVNEAFTKLTGYEARDVLGVNVAGIFGPESDRAALVAALAAVARDGSATFEFDMRVRDGRDTTLECSTVAFDLDASGKRQWVTVARDVGERRRLAAALQRVEVAEETNAALSAEIAERSLIERRLRHVALHDQLTGLPNRTLLLECLSRELAAERSRRCAVLFVDLDRFKVVNDALGHMAGDLLLVLFARRLEAGFAWKARSRDSAETNSPC
jgi:PAS domain S-box-containing protein